MNELLTKPRSGEEMQYAVKLDGRKVPIVLYSDLCRMFESFGPPRTIQQLYKHMGSKILILLQNPEKLNSGHWMSLTIVPRRKEIYFFSSYGGKPDEEKNRWLSYFDRKTSGQLQNVLNDSLKELHISGWNVHFNDHPYQVEGDGTATCGIWTAAFLNMDCNPDDFWIFVKRYHLSEYDLYRAFFTRRE